MLTKVQMYQLLHLSGFNLSLCQTSGLYAYILNLWSLKNQVCQIYNSVKSIGDITIQSIAQMQHIYLKLLLICDEYDA